MCIALKGDKVCLKEDGTNGGLAGATVKMVSICSADLCSMFMTNALSLYHMFEIHMDAQCEVLLRCISYFLIVQLQISPPTQSFEKEEENQASLEEEPLWLKESTCAMLHGSDS